MARAVSSRSKPLPASGELALHSKPHQLAGYLRTCLREGRLTAPLPGMRQWSQQLGVSRRTLHATLHDLQREGWLTITPRGIRLNAPPPAAAGPRPAAPRRVRWLLESTYRRHLHNYHVTFGLVQERLSRRGITISWETCPPARLRALARQEAPANELLLLASVPPAYQRLFAASGRPALVIGEVGAGLSLPYINADLAGIVRHATFRLLRRDCTRLVMVHIDSAAAGIRSAEATFQAACGEWTRTPVSARIFATALDQTSLLATMQRLVAGVKERTGILVLAPVPVGMVMTALLQHGIAVPAQAEIVALMHPVEATQLYPAPLHYPWPIDALARQITAAAEKYFATGRLPTGGKTVAIESARD